MRGWSELASRDPLEADVRRHMKRVMLACALVSTLSGADELVGTTIPPMPRDMKELGGTCITQDRGLEHVCDYSIAVLGDHAGGPSVIIGMQLKERDIFGKPVWFVTDAFPYPKLQPDYFLAVATCRAAGMHDESIVAVVKLEVAREWLHDVMTAWRFDLDQKRFITMPTTDLDCANEAWRL